MTSIPQLTYWGIGLAVFARQLCLPIPAILFLMTAGALAAHGQLHLSLVLLAGVLGCLAGDGVWFWFGRRWGSRIVRLLCRMSANPRACSHKAKRGFDRWGLRVLVIAKFVPGLDGVTPPLAGAEGSSVVNFVAYDAVGSFLWSAAYTALGFVFANQLDAAVRSAEKFGSLAAAVVLIPLLLYIGRRGFVLMRMIARLRLRRISPTLLSQKLQASEKVLVFDLLNFEDGDEFSEGIPGAVRIEPERLRTAPPIHVPGDLEMVLYCTSQREIISARVAIALRRRGFLKVWVLDGGLTAWRDLGFPLTKELDTPEQAASRLGIQLPPRWRPLPDLSE